MTDLTVRHATVEDLPAVLALYRGAKVFMRRSGNLTQWAGSYPSEPEALKDIADRNLYVIEDADKEIACVFAFITGNDPTYENIDGAWLNDLPYGTVHRIASSGKYPRMVEKCVDFCLRTVSNVRIDTHRDNRPMLDALHRVGFMRCGIIICADGTPREAFQISARQK